MATNVRPDANSFARIVKNISQNMNGPRPMMTTFQAGSAPLWLYVSGSGVVRLSLIAPGAKTASVKTTIRMVTVQPSGNWGRKAVAHDTGGVELGDFRTWNAAFSTALEYVCAPNWYAGAQNEHDAASV